MARHSRAVRAARGRLTQTWRVFKVRDHIYATLQNTFCGQHFDELCTIPFLVGLKDVCIMVSEADPSVDDEMLANFPPHPGKATQAGWRKFKKWLNSDMGKLVRDVCIQWCCFGRYANTKCSAYRGDVPIMVESDSDDDSE